MCVYIYIYIYISEPLNCKSTILQFLKITKKEGKNRGLPSPGINPKSTALQADSFPTEPPGKSTHLNHFAVDLKLTQHCKLCCSS